MGNSSYYHNGSVSFSCNMLNVFSDFIFLSLVILLSPSLSWVSLTSTGFGLVAISPLFSHLPYCSLAYFLSFCYLFCYLSLGVIVLFSFNLLIKSFDLLIFLKSLVVINLACPPFFPSQCIIEETPDYSVIMFKNLKKK